MFISYRYPLWFGQILTMRIIGLAVIAIPFLLSSVSVPIVATSSTCQPDFTLTVSPATAITARDSYATYAIAIASVCGFTGHVGWGPSVASPTPTVTCNNQGMCTSNGPVMHQSTYHVNLYPGHNSGGGTFSAAATQTTMLTTWTIRVTAMDVTHPGGPRHSVDVTLTVTDFNVSANPKSMTVPAGQTATSILTLTGQNGFSGTVQYSGTISPSPPWPAGLFCNLQPAYVTLSPTTTSASSTLSCSGSKGSYTITEIATPWSGSPSRSVSVSVTVT